MKRLLFLLLLSGTLFAQPSNWALYRRDTVSLVPTKYWVTANYNPLISNGTANQIYGMNSGGTAKEWKTFLGTTNQVVLTPAANQLTFALPQDIHSGASPSFANTNITTAYKIGGTNVLTSNTLGTGILNSSLTSVGTIGTGVWQGTSINGQYINYNTTNLKVTSNQLNTIQDISALSTPSFAGLGLTGNVTQTGNYNFSNAFVSGITGTGWRTNYNGTSSFLEIDNITVRNTLRTHIFQKDVVKTTNGYLYISDSGIISTIDAGNSRVGFLDSKSATFDAGTQIWVKDVNNTGTVISVKFTIVSVYSTSGGQTVYNVTVDEGVLSSLVIGMTGARISGGYLVADASSNNSPYLDVINSGVLKARLGNLAGINDPTYGVLADYGLYSKNIYLTGNANIAGTLTAGDENGFGNTFYAGKIKRNIAQYETDRGLPVNINSNVGISTVMDTDPFGQNKYVRQGIINAGSGNVRVIVYSFIGTPILGQWYTISLWIRQEGATAVTIGFEPNLGVGDSYRIPNEEKGITGDYGAHPQANSITTGWVRYTYSFRYSDYTPTTPVVLYLYVSGNTGEFRVAGVQVEKSEFVTPYQPVSNTTEPTLSGYGMWAIQGGFGGTIQNPKISLSDNGLVIRKDDATASTWLADNTISVGYSATEWGIIGKSGANKIFELGSVNQIAGWTFDNTRLASSTSGERIEFSSTDNDIKFYNATSGYTYIEPHFQTGAASLTIGSVYTSFVSASSSAFASLSLGSDVAGSEESKLTVFSGAVSSSNKLFSLETAEVSDANDAYLGFGKGGGLSGSLSMRAWKIDPSLIHGRVSFNGYFNTSLSFNEGVNNAKGGYMLKDSIFFDTMPVASRVLVSDANKKIVSSSVTSTELGYLSGVTSAVQTQINNAKPIVKIKTGDEPISNSTLQDDNHLIGISLEASSTYKVTVDLYVSTAGSVGGFKAALVTSTSGSSSGGLVYNALGVSDFQYYYFDNSSVTSHPITNGGMEYTGNGSYKATCIVTTGSAATLKLQWAQETSNASATTLKKGSSIELIKVQ